MGSAAREIGRCPAGRGVEGPRLCRLSALCNPPGNPGACGPVPGGTTTPVCLTVGGQSICALGCEGGLSCPGEMICINESDDTGPISICM
ncbi:MAG: hypothetical protein AB1Z98_36110 [Nannocystaceae bacterium]